MISTKICPQHHLGEEKIAWRSSYTMPSNYIKKKKKKNQSWKQKHKHEVPMYIFWSRKKGSSCLTPNGQELWPNTGNILTSLFLLLLSFKFTLISYLQLINLGKSVGWKSRALMILGLDPEKTDIKSEETGGGRRKVLR